MPTRRCINATKKIACYVSMNWGICHLHELSCRAHRKALEGERTTPTHFTQCRNWLMSVFAIFVLNQSYLLHALLSLPYKPKPWILTAGMLVNSCIFWSLSLYFHLSVQKGGMFQEPLGCCVDPHSSSKMKMMGSKRICFFEESGYSLKVLEVLKMVGFNRPEEALRSFETMQRFYISHCLPFFSKYPGISVEHFLLIVLMLLLSLLSISQLFSQLVTVLLERRCICKALIWCRRSNWNIHMKKAAYGIFFFF